MALRLAVLAGFGTAALAVSGLFDPVPYNRYSVAASVFIVSVTVSFAALSTLKIVAHSPLWIVVPCLLATALLPVWVVIGVTGMGYRSLDEMDFDEDGRTSLVEIVTAMNVVRVRSRDRPGCFEYIDAKAASETYRVTCNDFAKGDSRNSSAARGPHGNTFAMSQTVDEAIQMQAQARKELAASLSHIPGGRDLVDWFEGAPEFGDAEIVSLTLHREGPSRLSIALDYRGKRAVVIFELTALIDMDVRGFSRQNVIDNLKLRRADDREINSWEVGVGHQPGEWLIELGPCFGAYGTIRADIARIVIT